MSADDLRARRPRFNPELWPADYKRPDLNPYLRLHREFGPESIPADAARRNRGRWAEAFGRPHAPLHVEIGPGNGFFLTGMAAIHPEWSWLGIELRFKRVVLTARKIRRRGLSNARVARYDAWFLDEVFAPGEIAGLYVNFPDPWLKARDEKHRLMGPWFARWAAEALAPGGELRLKSDAISNLDALEAASEGLALERVARVEDIEAHGTPWPADDDIVTNYQRKFSERGEPVHALLLRRR